jgi:Flp pilus assembly protein CpaB
VDVLATVRSANSNATTRVLVANVPVLTAGTRYEQEQGTRDGKPIPSTVVTLMATPTQAEKIALASAEGQITLMLRNPLDVTQPETPGAHLIGLIDTEAAPARVAAHEVSRPAAAPPKPAAVQAQMPAPPAPSPAGVYTIEAIRAGKRTQETIQ